MKLQINGEDQTFDAVLPFTLAALVESLGMKPDRVAIELNRHIVPRDRWSMTTLNDGDQLEVVHFVGGGSERAADGRRLDLTKPLRAGAFVRFQRLFEDSPIRGYVLGIGPKFFVLALVSDRIRFDGLECFRIRDMTRLVRDPYANFVEAALAKQGQRKTRDPGLKLTSVEDLLLSAGKKFPLVAIHREKIDPDVCWIGRILGVNRGVVELLEINPDASWDNSPSEYSVKEITRVNFGGDYEDALYLVGGEPPAV
jgi:thiamine biosynthesis protein ThiS